MQPERPEQFRLHELGPDPAPDVGGIVEDQALGTAPMCSKTVRRPWQTHRRSRPRRRCTKRMFENGKLTTKRCRTCRIPAIMASACPKSTCTVPAGQSSS